MPRAPASTNYPEPTQRHCGQIEARNTNISPASPEGEADGGQVTKI